MEAEIIGSRIKQLRKGEGYTQEELAALIDFKFSQKQISRYENGEVKRLNYEFLKLMAIVFKVKVEDLVEEDYVKMSTDKRID